MKTQIINPLSILICTILVIASSCTTDEYVIANHDHGTKSIIWKRSVFDAIDIANQYLDLTKTRSEENQNGTRKLTVTPILDKNTRSKVDTLIYAVDINNNDGYLLISANKLTEPILAIIETGNYHNSQNTNYAPFNEFINNAKAYVRPPIDSTIFTIPIEHEIQKVFATKPRIPVKWGQNWPENMYHPFAPNAPVAIAQIMAYFMPNFSYDLTFNDRPFNHLTIDWNKIIAHNTSFQDKDVSQFKIEEHMNICPSDNYQHSQLAALIKQLDEWCCFTINGQQMQGYSRIRNTLNKVLEGYSYKPVTSGEGFYELLLDDGVAFIWGDDSISGRHYWTLDGVGKIEIIKYVNQNSSDNEHETSSEKIISKYVHCNWGWAGINNGFFLEGVFKTSEGIDIPTRTVEDHYYDKYVFGLVYKTNW